MSKIIQRPFSPATAAQLEASGIAPLLARIYAARGIENAEELDTDIQHLLPFSQLMNAEQMASLLADAIAAQKKLLIVADYDADGATACAIGVRGLGALGARVDFIVPNRFEFGYGLTPEIVRLAKQSAPDILLTVDNGIASVEGVAEAQRLGMQVLVTDHHLPGDTMPDAQCIVNPNQHGCEFPSKNLAGVGVMFYVLMALRAEMRKRGMFEGKTEPNLGNLLDLVALGTVADVVKLDSNNRILVQQGLQRIRAGRCNAGMRALLQVARKSPAQISSYELGFVVGPRLNAAGRLDDMSLGIRCLLTDDDREASEIAAKLDALNHERRSIEAGMQDTALSALDTFDPADSNSLTLFNEDWHQGVIGILAGRVKEKFHRPTFAFARGNAGELKASGRSIPGLHLRDALDLVAKRHPDLLIRFGGHAAAAGLTLLEDRLSEFEEAFELVCQQSLTPADLTRTFETDGALESGYYSLESVRLMQQEVWGQTFPAPLFSDEFEVLNQRVLKEKHLKLKLQKGSQRFDAIQFNFAESAPNKIRAAFRLDINEWNGAQNVQLMLEHFEAV